MGRSRHGAVGVAIALVVALACGCAHTGPASPADAAYGVPIAINTPQGLRAKQTMDMLNSDWPIGTVGVRTMAAPEQVNFVTSAMGNLWGDRPLTVSGAAPCRARPALRLSAGPRNVQHNLELQQRRARGHGIRALACVRLDRGAGCPRLERLF